MDQENTSEAPRKRQISSAELRTTVYNDRVRCETRIDFAGKSMGRNILDLPVPLDQESVIRWLQHEYAGVLYRLETRLYQGEFRAEKEGEHATN